MKTKLIPIIALLSVAWLYPACSKESPCEKTTEYKYILQEYKDLVPYKGGEKLTFLHVNTGDTVVFEGEPNWTQYFENSSYGSDCVIEKKLEGRGIAFFNSKSNHPIVINQNIFELGGTVFEIKFRDIEIVTGLLGSPPEKILDSINLHGKTYYNIYLHSNDMVKPAPKDFGCYYTLNDGIIKMFSKTGDTWELLSKN